MTMLERMMNDKIEELESKCQSCAIPEKEVWAYREQITLLKGLLNDYYAYLNGFNDDYEQVKIANVIEQN